MVNKELQEKAVEVFQRYDKQKRGTLDRPLCLQALGDIPSSTLTEIDSSLCQRTSLSEFLGVVKICKVKESEKPFQLNMERFLDKFSIQELRHFINCWEKKDSNDVGSLPIPIALCVIGNSLSRYRTKRGEKFKNCDTRQLVIRKQSRLEREINFEEYLYFVGTTIIQNNLTFRKPLTCLFCLPV